MELIDSREKLKRFLDTESSLYLGEGRLHRIKLMMLGSDDAVLWRYQRLLRIGEYHYNTGHKLRYFLYQRKKNRLGQRLGITIWRNCVDIGLHIHHFGSIVINGYARIGKNCQLHGENCIGNKGGSDKAAPVIGDNADIGIGAKVIGGITISEGVKVGAGAVVTHSCEEKGAVLVGMPAKNMRITRQNGE